MWVADFKYFFPGQTSARCSCWLAPHGVPFPDVLTYTTVLWNTTSACETSLWGTMILQWMPGMMSMFWQHQNRSTLTLRNWIHWWKILDSLAFKSSLQARLPSESLGDYRPLCSGGSRIHLICRETSGSHISYPNSWGHDIDSLDPQGFFHFFHNLSRLHNEVCLIVMLTRFEDDCCRVTTPQPCRSRAEKLSTGVGHHSAAGTRSEGAAIFFFS